MKKIIAIITALIFCTTILSAAQYRGFADFDASNSLGGSKHLNNDSFLIGISTTHGVQVNKLFLGAGAGIKMFMDIDDGLLVPLYAALRYDFFRVRPTNFFISAKVGYTIWSGIDAREGCCGIMGFDFTPSVGARFRLKPNLGINVALNFMPVDANNSGQKYFNPRLGISIGLDF